MDTFGGNLKYYMKIRGISSFKLSKDTGIAKGYISELLNDVKRDPGLIVICKLCKVLGVSPNELIPMYLWNDENGITNDKGSIREIKN